MKSKHRQSNFELLRVLAIFLIILFHIQLHGPQPLLVADNEFFALPKVYPKLLCFEVGISFGVIGNGLFIMISGYFMSENMQIDTGKISKKLLLQLGFATIILTLAYAVWFICFKDQNLYWEAFTLSEFNNSWWFIGYYLLVLLAAKLFLNKYIAGLSKKQFHSLLFSLLAVTQFGWSGGILDSLAGGLRTAFIGVFFFLMGGYIARYNPFQSLRFHSILLIFTATYALRFLSAFNLTAKGIDDYFKSFSEGNYIQKISSWSNYEITVVILVICLFELFRRWNIPYNMLINFLGKSTLMIYFIHENNFFISFYRNDTWMETLEQNFLVYNLKWLKWSALSFAVGLLAYMLYTILEKLLPKMHKLFLKETTC